MPSTGDKQHCRPRTAIAAKLPAALVLNTGWSITVTAHQSEARDTGVRLFMQPFLKADLEVARQAVGELLGVHRDLVVQVDGRRVLQPPALLVHGAHHLRVAVAHADGHDARKRLQRWESQSVYSAGHTAAISSSD